MIKRLVFLENFRTLGCLIGVSGGKALFQFLLNWDQFPTAALSSEVFIVIIILIIIINRYCHHTASCVDQVLGQRTVESIPAFLDCFPPPTSQCMCSKVSDSNIINMANKQNINSTKKASSPLRQNDKKQNQKTPTKQKSQKQKVGSYNCKAKKQQQLAHEQRKTT